MVFAKIFWSGNSQAVRLPKEVRFPPGTEEVAVHREGSKLILEPAGRADWPADFWLAFEGMPDGFDRPSQVRQLREHLDF